MLLQCMNNLVGVSRVGTIIFTTACIFVQSTEIGSIETSSSNTLQMHDFITSQSLINNLLDCGVSILN